MDHTKKTRQTVEVVKDFTRTKPQLLAENTFLRQQLIILNRQHKHPKFEPKDRFLLVLLAAFIPNWKELLLIVKPATLLGWHRQVFRLLWKFKSKPRKRQPKVPAETIALIK